MVLATNPSGRTRMKMRTPRQVAGNVMCVIPNDWQVAIARDGMIEALRWVLPHVGQDMRAKVSAKLVELDKPGRTRC
jgi:hypothetical protein